MSINTNPFEKMKARNKPIFNQNQPIDQPPKGINQIRPINLYEFIATSLASKFLFVNKKFLDLTYRYAFKLNFAFTFRVVKFG